MINFQLIGQFLLKKLICFLIWIFCTGFLEKTLKNMYLGLRYLKNPNRTKDHKMGNFCNGAHIMRDFSHKMRNFIKIVFWKQFSVLKGKNLPKFDFFWMISVEWITIWALSPRPANNFKPTGILAFRPKSYCKTWEYFQWN